MNIFAVDYCPVQSAKWLVDKHVVKMILETAQVLCAAFHLQSIEAPYKLTHKNHPSAVWLRQSTSNFLWALEHGKALCLEYTERYGKTHKTCYVYDWISANMNKLTFDKSELTPFALAMPDEFKVDNPVESYRNYYREGKKHLHSWKQNRPPWL